MYQVKFTQTAYKNLKKVDRRYLSTINKAIVKLSSNPHLGLPLKGTLRGFWKLKFSRYRIIYQIIENKMIVIVFDVAHRKEVYKK